MANLRANNLTGTGGRNAIDGSVYFDGAMSGTVEEVTLTNPQDYLALADSDDFFLSGDFTLEGWVYLNKAPAANNYAAIATQWESGGGSDRSVMLFAYHYNNDFYFKADLQTSAGNYSVSGPDLTENGLIKTWHHLAWVRNSNTLTLYLNGVSVGTATASGTTNNSTVKFIVGGEDNGSGVGRYGWNGFLSNVRLVNGTAVYTSNFTPPTEKLTAVENTVLLCCQDSDDPTQEATGKTITGYGGFRQDKTEGNLLINTLDWTGAASSKSTTMPANWTAGNGAEVEYDTGGTSGGGANRMLRFYNDGSSSYMYQTIPTVIGQRYQIDLWYEAQNSSLAIKWLAGTSANAATNGSTQWNVGSDGAQATQTGYFIATATTTYITFSIISGTDGASVFVDDIQVKAVNPKAPKVLPPVGIDEGVTFDGDTKVNTQGYMYFPTGDTSQRGRGRCIVSNGAPGTQALQYLQMQSGGIMQSFGNLANSAALSRGCGSVSYTHLTLPTKA